MVSKDSALSKMFELFYLTELWFSTFGTRRPTKRDQIQFCNPSTVKLGTIDRNWDSKIVAFVNKWSLFRGQLCNKSCHWDLKMVVVIHRWSLFGGGR
jgi:hypothetical protein